MAATLATRHDRAQPGKAELQQLMHSVMQRIAAWSLYRRSVRELSHLSGRELADLGLHRSEIRRVAYDSVYGARR